VHLLNEKVYVPVPAPGAGFSEVTFKKVILIGVGVTVVVGVGDTVVVGITVTVSIGVILGDCVTIAVGVGVIFGFVSIFALLPTKYPKVKTTRAIAPSTIIDFLSIDRAYHKRNLTDTYPSSTKSTSVNWLLYKFA